MVIKMLEIEGKTLKHIDIREGQTELIIPDGIEVISTSALSGEDKKSEIKKIVLPDGLVTIHNDAFKNCFDLEEVNFPDTLEYIGRSAFDSCISLKEINLNEGLLTICENAFNYCSIEKIYIPSTVSMMIAPFENKHLKEIKVSKDNKSYTDLNCNIIYDKLYNSIVQGCSTSKIPEGTKIIGKSSFKFINIDNVILPDSVVLICSDAFTGNTIKSIKLNKGLKRINKDAFSFNQLETLTLPKSLEYVEDFAINNCNNLKEIYINCIDDALENNAITNCKNLQSIYITDEEIDKTSKFYNNYKDIIKLITIDELIRQNTSFKEINKILKEQER